MDAVVKEQGKSDPFPFFFLFTMRIRAQGARKVKLPCSLLGTAITIAPKVPRTHEHTSFSWKLTTFSHSAYVHVRYRSPTEEGRENGALKLKFGK
jgi:hypothetical protein